MTEFTIESSVVLICDRCSHRMGPIDSARVSEFKERHSKWHEDEDLFERGKTEGHEVKLVTEWIDMDDSSGHAKCSCGFRSRSAKLDWNRDYGLAHLREVLT